MTKKMYQLIIGIVGGVAAIATAVVAFIGGPVATAVTAAIGIASTAVSEICALFVKNDETTKAVEETK